MAALHIIIFARTPVAGRVKTRLIGRLTAQQAKEMHEAMIADTLALVAALPLEAERSILFSDAVPPLELPAGIKAALQSEGDLGARLTAAIDGAFAGGAGKVILLGSDSPHLPPARIFEAERALEVHDLVLGPTDDGGYYLLGARAGGFSAAAFTGVNWGSARVYAQTIAAARAAGLSTASLAPWYDLDEWADLLRLARQAPPGLRTLAVVQSSKFKVQG